MTQIQLENGLYITDSTAEASAIVQADSTSQGFLPPRMTDAQRDAIVAPATGLMIFNTDDNAYNLYDGSAWTALGSNGIGDHGCFVYENTTVQTIANNSSAVPLSFSSELKDTDGYHDTTVNNSRLIIPNGQAGTYLITGNMRWNGSGGTYCSLFIRLNGSTTIAYEEKVPSTSSIIQVSTVYDLGEQDYIELFPMQSSGGNLNVFHASYSPTFRIQRIA